MYSNALGITRLHPLRILVFSDDDAAYFASPRLLIGAHWCALRQFGWRPHTHEGRCLRARPKTQDSCRVARGGCQLKLTQRPQWSRVQIGVRSAMRRGFSVQGTITDAADVPTREKFADGPGNEERSTLVTRLCKRSSSSWPASRWLEVLDSSSLAPLPLRRCAGARLAAATAPAHSRVRTARSGQSASARPAPRPRSTPRRVAGRAPRRRRTSGRRVQPP